MTSAFWKKHEALSLTFVERQLLLADKPDFPMQFSIRLQFDGVVHREELRAAFSAAQKRHPLLCAIAKTDADGGYVWVMNRGPEPELEIRSGPFGEAPVQVAQNIHERPGLAAIVQCQEKRWQLIVFFHHCVCDAIGANDFIADWLSLYDGGVNRREARLRDIDPDDLFQRYRQMNTDLAFRTRMLRVGYSVGRVFSFLGRSIRSLCDDTAAPGSPARKHRTDFLCCTLEHAAARSLIAASRRLKVSLNSLIVAAVLRDMATISGDHDAPSKQWFRLTVPINLRGMSRRRLPATNYAGIVFIDRPTDIAESVAELAKGVDEEMALVKKNQLNVPFETLHRIGKAFRLRGAVSRPNRSWSSALFTNPGPALPNCFLPRQSGRLVCAGSILTGYEFVSVLSAKTAYNFSLTQYAGAITICIIFDTAYMDRSTAGKRLDNVVQLSLIK